MVFLFSSVFFLFFLLATHPPHVLAAADAVGSAGVPSVDDVVKHLAAAEIFSFLFYYSFVARIVASRTHIYFIAHERQWHDSVIRLRKTSAISTMCAYVAHVNIARMRALAHV